MDPIRNRMDTAKPIVAAVVLLAGILLPVLSYSPPVKADAASNHSYSLIAPYNLLATVRPDLKQTSLFLSVGNVITASGESTVPISEAKNPISGTSDSKFKALCTEFMLYAKNYCASSDPTTTDTSSICQDGSLLKSMRNYDQVNNIRYDKISNETCS